MKTILSAFLLAPMLLFSQQTLLKGMVMDKNLPQNHQGVFGVNVYWLNTKIGATTNSKGWFSIPYNSKYKKLVVSFVGYKTDTINVKNNEPIHYFITEQNVLNEVTVTSQKKGTTKSYLQTENVFTVNSEELLKAACCNLAESFETNPSIDVNFSDALTGTRQIQMLGLKSPYLLIAQENIPVVRGASQIFGLTFTPGTWIESIQVTKGAGSVVNGFESISGQINTELVKPLTDKKIFVNGYANFSGRLELNTHLNKKITDKWSSGIYIYGNYRGKKWDNNSDGFLDNPLAKQFNIMNRWQYVNNTTGWISFLNVRYMKDQKQTGQVSFNPRTDKNSTLKWGSEIKTDRLDSSIKVGYVFPDLPFQSVGLQVAYNHHKQNSYFGLRTYNIRQQSIYTNLIFNSIIGDTRHKFKTGISFTYDGYKEQVEATFFNRTENAMGAFFEYTYDNTENFSAIAGVRIDYHNLIGTFLTPRLHIRYAPWQKGVLRASVGKGTKTTSIFAENQQLFASSRQINIENSEGKIYGLHPEGAWNYGVSYLQGFHLFDKKGDITFDFYQTNFTNQIVVDWENPQEISFYNLTGSSIANSFQVELNYNPLLNLDVRLAYKYFDVTTNYNSKKLVKPLQAKNRFFANASYQTSKNKNHWKIDVTYNFIGSQRLPNTNGLLALSSERYSLLNMQTTKVFSNAFEVYIGAENITNYKQKKPILGASNPFGLNFDSTLIYAPIFGRNFYLGFRYKLN